MPDTPALRLAAAGLVLPPGAALTGPASLWVRGVLTQRETEVIDVVVPVGRSMRPKRGLHVMHAVLRDGGVEEIGGLVVASPGRAIMDAARRLSLVETTVIVDATLHAQLAPGPWLYAYVQHHLRCAGRARAEEALELASSRAMSPMESRMRLLYVFDGFPPPFVNIGIYDTHDRLLGRPDLTFYKSRLDGRDRAFGVEYDGRFHDDPSVFGADLARQNRFVSSSDPLLRYDARAYYREPKRILAEGWTMWNSL